MRVTVVGCSGSFPGPESAASCYLVEADGPDADGRPRTWRLVLDLGSGALGPLQRYTALGDIDAVALSHLHADHCLDVCGLYVALRYDPTGPRGRVRVHGPSGTTERVTGAYGLPLDGMDAELDVRPWQAGRTVRIGPLSVTAHPVLHPVEAYGLRVEGPSETDPDVRVVLGYSGDTDACPGLDEVASGADVLLAEAAFHEGRDVERGIHLTGGRAGEAATTGGVGHLVLTHLPPWNDPARTRDEAARTFTGPTTLAAPGLRLGL